ncbi:uncharacterized protein LOC131847549 [Achroia grisella]|uniref:uncharacterized protein LOC131847549 n=1 Tax=Achroia grisella TaxID=688607 RepID=UPI0027D1EAB4|nr:uncharacterized protein LOC131847549 [Achroia grisella]
MVRFRENRVAVTGDIKDMFLRIKVREEDQNALRFLWRSSPAEHEKTYVMTSLIFGAKCSPFIAQFIKNKNALRYESSMPNAVAAICNQHYMDDYIDSLPDEAAAITMVRNISKIHKSGGFHICNWTSNSPAVLDSIPKESLGTTAVKFKIDQECEGERTLGLIWYPREDELGFDVSLKRIPHDIINGKNRPTKRVMLRVIMSIFDVFGFLSPFTIQGKIMLQDTWRAGISWDDLVTDDIHKKWCQWVNVLTSEIKNIRLPRWYQAATSGSESAIKRSTSVQVNITSLTSLTSTSVTERAIGYETGVANSCATTSRCNDVVTGATKQVLAGSEYSNLELHLCCDASTKAMCAVAYWRWYVNKDICMSFIASKCRVAPVSHTTVPRLELQAALLAARLADTIIREHKINPVRRYFWCDSSTVLHWICNNTRSYKTYIANRLGEIDELSRPEEWRYVPTKLNVADLATRENYDNSLFKNEWFRGPSFLYSDESSWPVNIIDKINEMSLERVMIIQHEDCNLPVPDPGRFSCWLRLVRATACILKFIYKCRKQIETVCTVMKRAERLLLKYTQEQSFGDEIAAIKNGNCLSKGSKLLTLSPFLDEYGILRVGGRIDAAPDVEPEMKRPIILDGRSQVSQLIVRYNHVKTAHGNQETVVNNLKQKYWIIRIRPTVKHVAYKCMFCRIKRAKPQVPRMGELPEARLAHHQRPFTHCGLDLFGPMEVTVGRHREKRYGVLFTCLTVRGIHLELVSSLTSDSLIMALRRMAARRGWPRMLYSDNGTNLRGADAELKKSINEVDFDRLTNEAANNGVEWTFIPPASPHWGGAWERLIRSVKTSLRVILKERAPREEVLNTLLTEVENIVNSRPLSHVSVEVGSSESLTPNHFMLGSSSNLPTVGVFNDSDLYLRKQWRKAQRLADMFWKRWVREVLPDLIPRRKWQYDQTPIQVGDFVLIVDPDAPRNLWLKAVVQQVFPGRDGRVRVVELKTKTGILKRPVTRVVRISMDNEC